MPSPSPKAPPAWHRQHLRNRPWNARWVRPGGVIAADWKSVLVRVGSTFAPRWFVIESIYDLNDARDSLRDMVPDWEATCAALRDAWDMHRQLRALRISATSMRLREIAALAEAGQ